MLHELLLALSGIPGDIFVLTQDENIQLLDTLAYSHPCEAELLNSLCKLGTAYFHIKKSISSSSHLSSNELGSREVKSLYIRAFVYGLRNVLQPYTKALLKLEEDVLKYAPQVNLSFIQAELDEYRWLLSLWQLVKEVIEKQVHGCNILDVIHRHSMSGMPVVQSAMKKLQDACHGVMLNQLSSWLLYGMLMDPYEEFFVQEFKKINEENGATVISETSNQTLDSDLGDFASIQEEIQGNETSPPNLKFCLRGRMIPSYFPVHLAESILFVGEQIKIFGGDIGLKKYSVRDSSIFQGKQHEFSKELHHLQQHEEFNMKKLETIVNCIRACVSEHLWTVVVENANLYGHLRAVKDFFLLGRGELYLAFIDQAGHLLNVVPSLSTAHDINKGFCMAARSVLIDEETHFDKFSLSLDGTTAGEIQPFGTDTEASCWTCIRMNYKPPNILHILFTPALLDRYNMIFKFLLNIKRVQLELQRCWEIQMGAKKKHVSYENVQQWHLRTCMAFLIDNIQYYLQVDVLDGQFSILTDKIKGTRDFEQIQMAHRVFVTDVLANTFVLMKPVFYSIQEFMKFCLSYCTVLKKSPLMCSSDLKVFQKEFHRYSALLFHVLSGASGHQSSPHLAQLLIRLDFNKYFSSVQQAF